ncbi:MAG: hypothetical protein Q8P67_25755, partial [archaeon]|nr:hypothetical protein [archaeon]
NAVWAWGDLFFPDDATTHFSMARDPPSWTELRWWAAWIFMSAFALVFVAWLSVLFALLTGHVLDEPREEDIIQDEYVDYLGGSSHHKKIPRDEFN